MKFAALRNLIRGLQDRIDRTPNIAGTIPFATKQRRQQQRSIDGKLLGW